jgi:uncharacterized RDD family membrane protein YckC
MSALLLATQADVLSVRPMKDNSEDTYGEAFRRHYKAIPFFSGFARRLLALLVDMTLLLPPLFYLGLANTRSETDTTFQIRPLGLLVILFYYAMLESSPMRASIGKLVTSQFVADEAGERLTFMHAMGRSVAKLITAFSAMLGFLTILFTKRNQALHDLVSRTCVMTRREHPGG